MSSRFLFYVMFLFFSFIIFPYNLLFFSVYFTKFVYFIFKDFFIIQRYLFSMHIVLQNIVSYIHFTHILRPNFAGVWRRITLIRIYLCISLPLYVSLKQILLGCVISSIWFSSEFRGNKLLKRWVLILFSLNNLHNCITSWILLRTDVGSEY